MTLKQTGFNTFLGVNKFYEIVGCENPFLIGRKVIHQIANKKSYISFEGSKKYDYHDSWDDFKIKYKIKNELTFIN